MFPPLSSLSTTLRVMLKAVTLVITINFICLATHFNPVAALTRVNLWGLVRHDRAYLVDVQNGLLPIDSLLAAHMVAYSPKSNDEFRVLILGNSDPYDAGLNDDETLSARLNERNIRINGKRLFSYNLAFPAGGIVSSTLVLEAALIYQPDLVISFVTANMFNNRDGFWDQNIAVFSVNRERLEQIASRYKMTDWFVPRPPVFALLGIHDQGTLAGWFNSLFYPFVQSEIPHPTWRIAQDPIPAEPSNFMDVPGTYPVLNPTWNFLDISQQMAESVGSHLLIINQPTLVVDGPHSDVSYSRMYGRAFYDTYYATLKSYTLTHHLWYLDMWRTVAPEDYTDGELYIDPQGTVRVADELARQLSLRAIIMPQEKMLILNPVL